MEHPAQISHIELVGRRPQYLQGYLGKTIVAVLAGELNIYSYEGRRSKAAPKLEKMLKVVGEVKMMQIAKDSLLVVFFEDSVHSYYLDGPNSRQNSRK